MPDSSSKVSACKIHQLYADWKNMHRDCIFISEVAFKGWILQVATLLDQDFFSISSVILTHFKPLLYKDLHLGIRCPLVLNQQLLTALVEYLHTQEHTWQYSSSRKLDLLSPTYTSYDDVVHSDTAEVCCGNFGDFIDSTVIK